MEWMEFMFRQDEDGVIHFQGTLSIHELERLRVFLLDLLHSEQGILLSLAKVTGIDAAALQLLIAFRISLPVGRSWRVVAISEQVERILMLSGLKGELFGPGS